MLCSINKPFKYISHEKYPMVSCSNLYCYMVIRYAEYSARNQHRIPVAYPIGNCHYRYSLQPDLGQTTA